jgi:hypothetical protein
VKINIYRHDEVVKDNFTAMLQWAATSYLHMWGITKINLIITLTLPDEMFDVKNAAGGTLQLPNDRYLIHINEKFLKEETSSEDQLHEHLHNILSHEIVHVKQYFFNELEEISGKQFFRGVDISKIPYEKAPHEVEAYHYQTKMVDEFFQEQLVWALHTIDLA